MSLEHPYAIAPTDPTWPSMITPTAIPGLFIYERPTFPDDRGFFREPLEKRDLETVLGAIMLCHATS